MNTARGNKATRSKEGILADTKELIRVMTPALQRMPKIERIEGAAAEMRRAAWDMVGHFQTAWCCPDVRAEYIRRLFGDYGKLQAAFEQAVRQGLLTDGAKLAIAVRMERIEEGVSRWYNALGQAQRQERGQVAGEARVSTSG